MKKKEEGKKKIADIDWEKHLQSYGEDDMIDDHGNVILGSRDQKPVFQD